MDNQEPLLDVKHVASALGVSEQWLYEQTRLNEFPHVRIGRLLRFRRSDVDHYIASRTRDGLGFPSKNAKSRPDPQRPRATPISSAAVDSLHLEEA